MISRTWCVAACALAALHGPSLSERELVERGLVMMRLDPKLGAAPGECDELSVSDLSITVNRRPALVTSVERVPRPVRHWLLIDVSESAAERRTEAQRSAAQYAREVMTPGIDVASVVTVDEDPLLVAGSSGDPSRLARAIEGVPPGGWSALRDGLDQVLRQIEGDRHEHLILFWTDGEDQSSVVTAEELLATLARAPNATVFPIALLPAGAKFPPPPLTGATFTEVARRSGGEVFVSSDPRWLDRVRGWIGRRFAVAFAPPRESSAGPGIQRGIEIAVLTKRCRVTSLADPFARPDPVAGAAPPAPRSWLKLYRASGRYDESRCDVAGSGPPWNTPLRPTPAGLTGCMLDFVRAPGPSVRERDQRPSFELQAGRLAARELDVAAPELARLPVTAAEAVDEITAPGARAFDPRFMDGNALLAQRAPVATSLFAGRADYRNFALARLRRAADEELRALERELAHAFPELPAERIAAAARESRAGRRALDAARTPTDADLARVLAAWIRDVPAADLLRELETFYVDRRIARGKDPALAARWAAAFARFGLPLHIRVAAPLSLVRDREQDVVGFVRVVLPRPERFQTIDSHSSKAEASLDARLPLRPFGFELTDAVAAQPDAGRLLAARGYRCASIVTRPADSVDKKHRMRPFSRAHVTVVLEAPPADGIESGRVVLEADMSASAEGFTILNFAAEVLGDPALEAALAGSTW